jgi:hypothetical protein
MNLCSSIMSTPVDPINLLPADKAGKIPNVENAEKRRRFQKKLTGCEEMHAKSLACSVQYPNDKDATCGAYFKDVRNPADKTL